MNALSSATLMPLWLPIAVALVGFFVLVVDSLLPMGQDAAGRGRSIGLLTAALLSVLLLLTWFVDGAGAVAGGAYVGSAWTLYLHRLLVLAAILAVLGAVDELARRVPRRQGEYWLLLLMSLTGMLLLPGARDLLLLVVSFELMGIPLYVLCAYAKTDGAPGSSAAPIPHGGLAPGSPGRAAAEAGLKLYLVGATSTAITLFGVALLIGFTGTARLADLGATTLSPLAVVGTLFVLAGFGFKLGMVPFHMWVPDTYQGAPTPFVAFLSVGPKAAGVAALGGVFLFGLHSQPAWRPALALLAFLTMAVGNFMALPQTDTRRLLAYSGIAQMGYVLVALAGGTGYGAGMAAFFLFGYVFTNMGAFLVVHAVADSGAGNDIESLSGLFARAPLLALSLLLFLLSLAGIPFVIGFWAKLYVFLAAWRAGLALLVIAGIVLAAIGLFYYLRVARAAYMLQPGDRPILRPGAPLSVAIGLCLLGVVLTGLYPRPFVDDALKGGADLVPTSGPPTTAAR